MPFPPRPASDATIAQGHAMQLARLPSLLQDAWQQSQAELFDKLDKWLDRQQHLVDSLLRNNVEQYENEAASGTLPDQPEVPASVLVDSLDAWPLPLQLSPKRTRPENPVDLAEQLKPLPERPEPPDPAKPPMEEQVEAQALSPKNLHRVNSLSSDAHRGWLAMERSQSYLDAQDVGIAISKQQGQSEGSIQTVLQKVSVRVTSDWKFDLAFSAAVFLNAVLIGVEVEYAATHAQTEHIQEFPIMQHCFTAVFLLELLVRVCAEGFAFFCASAWNMLDTALVFASLLEVCLAFFFSAASDALNSSSNLRLLRIMRMTRLAKLVRIVRFVRFIRALRTLTMSIVSTLKSLLWSMLLLASILFIFGVLFTDVTTNHLNDVPRPWEPSSAEATLSMYFTSIPRTMLTLYACILGGLEWHAIAEALEHTGWFYRLVFDAYISFACLAFLNVVTGVFCHSAIESAQRDHDMLVNSMIQNKEFWLAGLEKVFANIDDDHNGAITITEFERHFDDAEVRNLLEALGLDPLDAWSLFGALDSDDSHTINAQEFLEGCLYLRGTASAIDVAHIKKELQKIKVMLIEQAV